MAIASQQHKFTTINGATSFPLAFNGNVLAGSLIVVVFRLSDVGRTITVSDNNGGSYLFAVERDLLVDGDSLFIYYAMNHASGATTVTVAVSGANTNCRLEIDEYSGVATTNALDKTNSNYSASANTLTPGNIVTTQANEVIIAAAQSTNAGAPLTVDVSYNLNASDGFFGEAEKIVSSTGTYSATWTYGAGSVECAAVIASFSDTPIPQGGGVSRLGKLNLLGVGY